MGWSAYPFSKSGQIIKCPISMHSGRYRAVLERMGVDTMWQPDRPEKGEPEQPCMDPAYVARVLANMKNPFECQKGESEHNFNHVKQFMQWCVDHECGVWFSF